MAAPAPTATVAPTPPSPAPTPTPSPVVVTLITHKTVYTIYELSSQDVLYLAALCVVETKNMDGVRADACRSVVSTVLARMRNRVLSDGTVAGTLTWNCKTGDIACQFPAYVVNGCETIKPNMCPYNYSSRLIDYVGIVDRYLRNQGSASASCTGYLFYDLRHDGTDCKIEATNGSYINFHQVD